MANALNQLKAMNKKDNYAIGFASSSEGGGCGSSVLDDLIEGKEGVHLVSNAESVADGAFKFNRNGATLGLYLETVNLPNATSIGNSAFEGCSALTSVDLPNVESIGNAAFVSCSALTSISIPNVTSIGNGAFGECSALTSINLPNVTSIGQNAFYAISSTAVINIGAAGGEISGAPWGAPEGVTINYNANSK